MVSERLIRAGVKWWLTGQGEELATALATDVVLPRLAQQSQRQQQPQQPTLPPSSAVLPDSYWSQFAEFLNAQPTGVWIIVGKRGSGKTALSVRITQELKRKTYGLGLPRFAHIQPIDIVDVVDMPAGSVLIIDDSTLFYSSKSHMTQTTRAMERLVDVSRHRDLVIIANVQHSAALDKYLLDPTVFFIKPPSLLYGHQERPHVKPFIDKAAGIYKQIPIAKQSQFVYVVTDDFEGMLTVPLPRGWTEELSKNKAESLPEAVSGRAVIPYDERG